RTDVDRAAEDEKQGDRERSKDSEHTDDAVLKAGPRAVALRYGSTIEKQVDGPEKSGGAEREKAELAQDLDRDGSGVENSDTGRGVGRHAAQVRFGERRDKETVGKCSPDEAHVAGEKCDQCEPANQQTHPAQGIDGKGKYHRENDQDENAVDDSVLGTEAD